MAIAEAFTGTETISTTEWSLTTDSAGPDLETSDGTFCVVLDTSAIVAGEVFELRFYEKARSGDTQRLMATFTLGASPGFISPWLPGMHGFDWTLVKVSGTDRAIHWSIRKYA